LLHGRFWEEQISSAVIGAVKFSTVCCHWSIINICSTVNFTADDHFGFEAGSWYWHFVDVVWVCLVAFVYVM
jgi:heme/copper-type cytochrome/quinol oxidase subunit 3